MLKIIVKILLFLFLIQCSFPINLYAVKSKKTSEVAADLYKKLPKQGKKVLLGGGEYLVYRLEKNASKKVTAVRLEVYDKNSNRKKKLKIIGTFSPVAEGRKPVVRKFSMNEIKEYVLSAEGLSSGKWDVKIDLYKNEKVSYRGKIRIKI